MNELDQPQVEPVLTPVNEELEGLKKNLYAVKGEKVKAQERAQAYASENEKLSARLQELERTLEELAPVARELKDENDRKLFQKEGLEGYVNKRLGLLTSQKEKELLAIRQEREAEASRAANAEAKLRNHLLSDNVYRSAISNGINKDVVEFVVDKAKGLFDVVEEDGKTNMVMKSEYGKFGSDGKPIGVDEWILGFKDSAPSLFQKNVGAGLRGSGPDDGKGNPWDPKSTNLTKQIELINTNPALARAKAAQFGMSIP